MIRSGRNFLTLGILNITPDSFSDGGLFLSPSSAFDRAIKILDDGADFIDVGAESTRPGAESVSEVEEWQRLEPFLEIAIRKNLASRLSIDTRKISTMRRVAEMKVAFINCVGPIPEIEELAELITVNRDLRFIASHIHGTPKDMQLSPLSAGSAIKRVNAYFESAEEDLLAAGFEKNQIYLDPGIGFGKTDAANLALLLKTTEWSQRYNIALGVSRKGFLGRVFGGDQPRDRDPISKLTECGCILAGASVVRTHDVSGLMRAFSVFREALG